MSRIISVYMHICQLRLSKTRRESLSSKVFKSFAYAGGPTLHTVANVPIKTTIVLLTFAMSQKGYFCDP